MNADRFETRLNACSLEVLQANYPLGQIDGNDGVTSTSCSSSLPLIIGCYQLNESKKDNVTSCPEAEEKEDVSGNGQSQESTRSGELVLFDVSRETMAGDSGGDDSQNFQFGEPMQYLETGSGILDGKWFQESQLLYKEGKSSYLYATACASGSIEIYSLDHHGENKETKSLQLVGSSDSDGSNGLSLSLDWEKFKGEEDMTHIVSSYSNGSLAIHNAQPVENQLVVEEIHRWDAHTLFGCPSEVWTTCFATNKDFNTYKDTIISGGDDCKMKVWDIRCHSKAMHIIGDSEFDAGVTAVTYHPSQEHIFAVGSYDESVRIWDMRFLSAKSPPMKKIHVGGGVWRVKWHPVDKSKLLIGAMHGGCRILNVGELKDELNSSIEIIREFTHHESMAYGADWLFCPETKNDAAVSCSFYDRQAIIW